MKELVPEIKKIITAENAFYKSCVEKDSRFIVGFDSVGTENFLPIHNKIVSLLSQTPYRILGYKKSRAAPYYKIEMHIVDVTRHDFSSEK